MCSHGRISTTENPNLKRKPSGQDLVKRANDENNQLVQQRVEYIEKMEAAHKAFNSEQHGVAGKKPLTG